MKKIAVETLMFLACFSLTACGENNGGEIQNTSGNITTPTGGSSGEIIPEENFNEITKEEFINKVNKLEEKEYNPQYFLFNGEDRVISIDQENNYENVLFQFADDEWITKRYVSTETENIMTAIIEYRASFFANGCDKFYESENGALRSTSLTKGSDGLGYTWVFTYDEHGIVKELDSIKSSMASSSDVVYDTELHLSVSSSLEKPEIDPYVVFRTNRDCSHFSNLKSGFEIKVKAGTTLGEIADRIETPVFHYGEFMGFVDEEFELINEDDVVSEDVRFDAVVDELSEKSSNSLRMNLAYAKDNDYEISEPNKVNFTLDLTESSNDFYVMWGDGAVEKISAKEDKVTLTHDYTKYLATINQYRAIDLRYVRNIYFNAHIENIEFANNCGNSYIDQLFIYDPIENIGSEFIDNMKSLIEVDLNVRTIDNGAFLESDLRRATLRNVQEIGHNVFLGCDDMLRIDLSYSLSLRKVGDNAFETGNGATDVYLPCFSLDEIEDFSDTAFGDTHCTVIYGLTKSIGKTKEFILNANETRVFAAVLDFEKNYVVEATCSNPSDGLINIYDYYYGYGNTRKSSTSEDTIVTYRFNHQNIVVIEFANKLSVNNSCSISVSVETK